MIRLGIKWKLLLIYLVLVVPLVAVIAVVHLRWYEVRRDIAVRERLNIARLTAANFETYVSEMQVTLGTEGANILENGYTPAVARPLLRKLMDTYPLSHVVLLDSNGKAFVPTDNRLSAYPFASDPAVKGLLGGQKANNIEPLESVMGDYGFHVSRAVYLAGRLRGIVVGFVDPDLLRQKLNVGLPAGGQTILDSEGRIVYHSESHAAVQASWRGVPLIEEAFRWGQATSSDFSHPPVNESRVAALTAIGDLGWLAGSSVTASEVLDPVRESVIESALVAASGLVLALALSSWIFGGILRSLRRLAAGARLVGQGDFDQPISVRTGDEVGEVAASMEETRLELKAYVEALSAIAAAGRLLAGSLQVDQLKEVIARSLEELFGASACWVLLLNERTGRLEFLFVRGKGLERLASETLAPGEGVAGRVFTSGRPALIRDLRDEPEAFKKALMVELGLVSLVHLPLAIGERTFGVLGMSSPRIAATDFGSREMELLGTFASQVSIALQNARLFTERERSASLGLSLNSINARLISTLDLEHVMGEVMRDAVNAVGCERAVLALLEEDESWRVHHAVGVQGRFPREGLSPSELPVSTLAAQTRSVVVSNDAYNDPRIPESERRRLGLRSFMAVPLLVHAQVRGVISFANARPHWGFTEDEVDFARKLSTSMSLAMENARLYAAEQNIADTLQEALLTLAPEIPGLEFGQLYRSATEMARVGGDFFDLFDVEHDRAGIVIGDVSGKGLEAAALTSLVKNTIKAYAYDGSPPGEILAKTNEVVIASSPAAAFVTVFLGILDKGTGRMTYATAGHPPGLLRHHTGEVDPLESPSTVLGVFAGRCYPEGQALLDAGDVLVLYTDGVIEARRDGSLFGEDRLRRLVSSLEGVNAKEMPRRLFTEVMRYTNGVLSDDLAVLALSVSPERKDEE